MKNIWTLLAILFSTWALMPCAQTPAYLHYGVEEGLPSSLVYCTLQDKKGFMWFGTDNGLARFDGVWFKVYGIEDGLPDPEVLNLFEDSQERLWISCFQKKPCYLKDGKIFNSENDSLLSEVNIKGAENIFFEDEKNDIWVTGKDSRTICIYQNNSVKCIKPNLGTALPYLKKFREKLFAYNHTKIVDFTNQVNPTICYNSSFNYISFSPTAYSHNNVFYFSKGSFLEEVILEGNNFTMNKYQFNIPNSQNKIGLVENENIWLCYPKSLAGAYKISLNKLSETSLPSNYLYGKPISNIFKDKEQNFWFTTLNDGVFSMLQKAAMVYNRLNSTVLKTDNITAITLLQDGKLIIGSETGNIYMMVNGNFIQVLFQNELPQSKVRQIVALPENGWIAAMDNFLYAEKNGILERGYTSTDGKGRPLIVVPKYIYRDIGKTWVAHIGGLYYWNDKESLPVTVIYGKRFTAIGKDSENVIWAGGMNGLLSQKDSFQINWGERFMEIGGRIIDIKQGNKNQLWVATAEHGLLKVYVKNGEVESVEVINDVLDDKINGIKSLFKSENGKIWLATNNGIYELDDELKVRHIDKSDGLPSNDVNALAIDHDTLWAATVAGLAKVQLNQNEAGSGFLTYISGVQYDKDGKRIRMDLTNVYGEHVQIPPDASMIDIQFSGLHYSSGGNITFEYVVEEDFLPLNWITWSNLRRSLSHKVSPNPDTFLIKDHHRNLGANTAAGYFKVKATAISKNGTVSDRPDVLVLSILPHWYETVWFSLIVAGVIFLVLWRFYQQRTAMKKFERTATELQLQAIKAQINPHFIGNSINAIQQFFYPPDPIKASQYISTFTSLLRQTMYLSEVPFISFGKELIFIEDYLKMVKLRFGDRFEYEIKGADGIPDNTPFPAMILQPIIENGTIHGLSPEGLSKLEVDFNLENNLFYCTISDNGIGIDASKAIRKNQNIGRISKGIDLLKKKIEAINNMYGIKIKIDFTDLSTLDTEIHGTRVTMSFSPDRITQDLVGKD